MRLYFRVAALSITLLCLVATGALQAQPQKQIPPSLKATVSQTLGLDTVVTITYSRPGVKGREIWGKLVPYGMEKPTQYSNNKPFPWRAGANENTTIEVSKDVLIEGKLLPMGKYGIHMIAGPEQWKIMFNKVSDAWGSYSYDATKDALQITVTPVKAPHQEWLVYGFDDLAGTSATAFLHWETLKVPFKIQIGQSTPPTPRTRGSAVGGR